MALLPAAYREKQAVGDVPAVIEAEIQYRARIGVRDRQQEVAKVDARPVCRAW